MLQQLGIIALYAQTPLPGRRRGALPPGAAKLSTICLYVAAALNEGERRSVVQGPS
jgi:hypothetical protein